MNVNGGTDYQVSGILKDVPANSHFKFNIIIPFESGRDPDTDWQWSGFYTYARLKPGADTASFASDVRRIVKSTHTGFSRSILHSVPHRHSPPLPSQMGTIAERRYRLHPNTRPHRHLYPHHRLYQLCQPDYCEVVGARA